MILPVTHSALKDDKDTGFDLLLAGCIVRHVQTCAYGFIGPIFIISTLPNALTRSRGEYCRVVGINIEG